MCINTHIHLHIHVCVYIYVEPLEKIRAALRHTGSRTSKPSVSAWPGGGVDAHIQASFIYIHTYKCMYTYMYTHIHTIK